MRAIIQNRYIVFAQQAGDSSKRAAKSAVKKHGVFAPEKFCHLPFKFAVQIRHAGKHRRTACAETVRPQRFMRCGEDFGMICQPEVIVGTEVYYRARPAVVIDGRACIGTRKQLWFIKFHRERGLSHPMCESGRRLERIARFVSQKITETEFCRVLTHQVVNCLSLASVSTEGASRQSSELLCFTDSLRSSPLHPHAAEFRLGAANLAGFGFQDKTFESVIYRPWTAYFVWLIWPQGKATSQPLYPPESLGSRSFLRFCLHFRVVRKT